MNARMSDLKACFEQMGFADVRTLLSSGNVAFTSDRKSESNLASAIEAGMVRHLGRSFPVIVRKTAYLRTMLEADPYSDFQVPPQAKKVVTFLMDAPPGDIKLPLEREDAAILAVRGREVFSAYVANERGPVFMALIEKTFGKRVTTRTWDTVRKCAAA